MNNLFLLITATKITTKSDDCSLKIVLFDNKKLYLSGERDVPKIDYLCRG